MKKNYYRDLENEYEVTWQPHPGPQTEVLKRTEHEILFGGARGGGKTDAGIAWLLRHIDNPKYRALIIRKNAQDLSDWVDRARDMYRPTRASFAYKPAEITFPSGATFRTGHLKDENAYGKYIGHEYQRMVIEELTQIPEELLYLKLLSSNRSTVDGIKPQVFCTTNPGDIGHNWVKERFIVPSMPGRPFRDPVSGRERIYIPSRITDNYTLMSKDPSYIKYLESLPETQRRAWLEGDWDIIAGQVFTEWNRALHVVEPFAIPQDWPVWLALDWGVNMPSSVGWYTRNYDGRVFLYRELYFNGTSFHKRFGAPLTPSRLAKVILLIIQQNKEERYGFCAADPSLWNKVISGKGGRAVEGEGESIAETILVNGLRMIKGDNDRVNGLGRYREMLSLAPDGKPWYQVFSSCADTIRTIPALPYDMNKLDDVDTDAEDHCYDRDRYFFMSRPVRPEMVIKTEQSLLSRFFRKKVKEYEKEDEETESADFSEEDYGEWFSA